MLVHDAEAPEGAEVIQTRRPPPRPLVHGGGSGVYRHASPLGAGGGGIRFRQLRKNHVRRTTPTSQHPDHRGRGALQATPGFPLSSQRCSVNRAKMTAPSTKASGVSPVARHAPVEAFEHDGVFRAQVVRGQGAGLPAQALVGVGQVLRPGDVCAELKASALTLPRPRNRGGSAAR